MADTTKDISSFPIQAVQNSSYVLATTPGGDTYKFSVSDLTNLINAQSIAIEQLQTQVNNFLNTPA